MDVLGWNKDEIESLDMEEYSKRLTELIALSIEADPVKPGFVPMFDGGTRWKKRCDVGEDCFKPNARGRAFPFADFVEKSLERNGAVVWDLTFDAFLMLVGWHHGEGFPPLVDGLSRFPQSPAIKRFPSRLLNEQGTTYHKNDPDEAAGVGSRIIHVSAQTKFATLSPEELRLLEAPNTGTGVAIEYLTTLPGCSPAARDNGSKEDNEKETKKNGNGNNCPARTHSFFDREGRKPFDPFNWGRRAPLDIFKVDYNISIDDDLGFLETNVELLAHDCLLAESIQLGLLRILLLLTGTNTGTTATAECEELWNDAMDAFRLGEAALRRRGVMLYHVMCVSGPGASTGINNTTDNDNSSDDDDDKDANERRMQLKNFIVDTLLYSRTLYEQGVTSNLESIPDVNDMVLERLSKGRPVPGVVRHTERADMDTGPLSAACAYHRHGGQVFVFAKSCPSECAWQKRVAALSGDAGAGDDSNGVRNDGGDRRKRVRFTVPEENGADEKVNKEEVHPAEVPYSPSVPMTDAPPLQGAEEQTEVTAEATNIAPAPTPAAPSLAQDPTLVVSEATDKSPALPGKGEKGKKKRIVVLERRVLRSSTSQLREVAI